jgi:hypothetical protein
MANLREYDEGWSDRPSTAIAMALAAALDREPTDGPALDGYIDTDALDNLLSADPPRRGGPTRISFVYDGVEVVVDSDGEIIVRGNPEETS